MALMTHDAFSLRGLVAGCALLVLVAPAVQAAEQLPDAPSIDARAWILMDYGDLIVHIFSRDDRLFYDLERIWRDGKVVENVEEL